MEGAAQPPLRTVEEVFNDFKSRRAGIVKALTSEVANFYKQCDPDKENLCLYGLANGTWKVELPVEEVPPELPEPALGINFARDGMQERDWLSLVAVYSDAWLLAVAFFNGTRFGFGKSDRRRLFQMMNDLPTVFEVMMGAVTKQAKKEQVVGQALLSKNQPSGAMMPPRAHESQTRGVVNVSVAKQETGIGEDDDEEDEEDEQGETLCGACGENYASDEFWICCDLCETWFHGKCVKITPAKAEHIKQYKCPSCTNRRPRA